MTPSKIILGIVLVAALLYGGLRWMIQQQMGGMGYPPVSTPLPSGAIIFIESGTCPTAWTEDTALVGRTVVATIAANGNVGNQFGSNSITPAFHGTAQTFTLMTNISLLGILGNAAFNGPNPYTPAGTIDAIDPHPASVFLIPCKAN